MPERIPTAPLDDDAPAIAPLDEAGVAAVDALVNALVPQDVSVPLASRFQGPADLVASLYREVRYDPGFIAIGWLIPVGKGRWLRSQGMLIFSRPGDVTARDLAEGFEKFPDLAPALIAEGLIAGVAGRGRVPRAVPPAASPAEAQALLEAAGEVLDAHGLRRVVPEEEVPAEFWAPEGEQREYYAYEVDEDMAAWIAALDEQARRAKARKKRRGKRRLCARQRRERLGAVEGLSVAGCSSWPATRPTESDGAIVYPQISASSRSRVAASVTTRNTV